MISIAIRKTTMMESRQPKARHLAMVVFVSIVIAGSGLFVLAFVGRIGSSSSGFGAVLPSSSSNYIFGSLGRDFIGWQIPSNAAISTSYTTNQSLNGFVSATLNVFPYSLPKSGTLYLGLYVNGKLAANSSYDLGQSVAHPAAVVRYLVNGSGSALASFTPSLEGYSVTLFLHSSLPSGTVITITTYVSNPVWVQIDSGDPGLSRLNPTSSPLPTSLGAGQALAPYTLSIQVQSNAA